MIISFNVCNFKEKYLKISLYRIIMLETRKIFGNIAQRCDEIVPSSDSIAIESDEGLYRVTNKEV